MLKSLYISLALSIFVLGISILKKILRIRRDYTRSSIDNNIKFLRFSGILLSVFLVNLGYCLKTYSGSNHVLQICHSIIGTFQTFTFDIDYKEFFKTLDETLAAASFWTYYSYLVFILSPIIEGVTVLSFIGSFFPEAKSSFKFWFCKEFRRKIYLFSSLNEQSLCLASELRELKKDSNVMIVFANCRTDIDNEEHTSLVNRALDLRCYCVKWDLSSILLNDISDKNLLKKITKKEVSYFFVNEDDVVNLDEAVYMCTNGRSCWENCSVAKMYVFAQNDFSKTLLEKIAGNRPKPEVWIIPYKTNTIYNLLLNHPLFLYTQPSKLYPSKEELNISITGDNDWAVECFKTVLWLGQMKDVILNINCYTADPDEYQNRLNFLIPELSKFKKNFSSDNWNSPHCTYSVECYQKSNLMKTNDTNIWFVCGDSDQDSIDTANYIAQYSYKKTTILYQVNKTNICDALNDNAIEDATDPDNVVHLYPFGSWADQYSSKHFSGLLADASVTYMNHWKTINTAELAIDNEYKRRSSFAEALHLPYKLFYIGRISKEIFYTSAKKETVETLIQDNLKNIIEQPLSDQELDEICKIEHIRWMAYMRSIGFQRCKASALPTITSGNSQDTKDYHHKLHIALVSYKNLDKVSDQYRAVSHIKRNFIADTRASFPALLAVLYKKKSDPEQS